MAKAQKLKPIKPIKLKKFPTYKPLPTKNPNDKFLGNGQKWAKL